MKIKLDENISRHLKPVLNKKGHETVTAEDEGLLGKADVEVGEVAKNEGRMLFTLDLEFANLHKFPPEPSRRSSFSTSDHGPTGCEPLHHSIHRGNRSRLLLWLCCHCGSNKGAHPTPMNGQEASNA